jgi:hypothetical protein
LRTTRLPLAVGRADLGTRPHYRLRTGSLLGLTHLTARMVAEGPVVPLLVLEPTGEVADTIAMISRRNRTLLVRNDRNPRSNEYVTTQPFGDWPLFATAPDGSRVFIVERRVADDPVGTVTVTALSDSGDTIWTVEHAAPAISIPETLRDSVVDLYSEAAVPGMWSSASAAKPEVSKRLFLPAYLPPVTDAVATSEGGIWLRQAERPEAAGATWLMIGPDGTLRGTVQAALGLELYFVAGNRVLGVRKDSLGVSRVTRLNLRAGDGT